MRDKRLSWSWFMFGMLLAACALLIFVDQARGDLADCIDATCRITSSAWPTQEKGLGTGCVFEISQGVVYVLTAAHVVPTQTVQCEFWQHGHQSGLIPGTVINRCTEYDVAIVALKTSAFGGRLPKAIPIAPASRVLQPGEPVTSVGCANGAWSTGWKGHMIKYEDHNILFRPTPAGGRSGSAIFDEDAEMIVGLLHSRSRDDTYGIATSTRAIRTGFRSSSKTASSLTQCGPDGCEIPGRGIPGRRPIMPYGGKLIPWKKQPQQQSPQSGNPWPTLPSPVPATPQAVTVDVDLTPISNQLTEITDLLLEMRETHHPSEPTPEPLPYAEPPPLPTADFEARQMADTNHGMILAVQEESTKGLATLGGRLEKNESNLGTAVLQIKELASNHGSLKERMEARLEKVRGELGEEASKREVRVAYIKDLVAEKMGDGGVIGLLKLLGMPAAVIIAAWFVGRRIHSKLEAGEPLLIQQALSEVGELRGRIRERFGRNDPPPQPPVMPLPPAATPPVPPAAPPQAAT